jgi:hypothetical protein
LKPLIKPVRRPFSGVVLVLRDRLAQYTAHDPNFAFPAYLREVFGLAEELSASGIRVLIRSHPADYSIVREAFLGLGEAKSDNLHLQSMSEPLKRAFNRGFAPVFCYDSTGVLEIAAAGGECFVFSPDGLEHVQFPYAANYQALSDNGLLETDAGLAASAIIDWLNSESPLPYRRALKTFAAGIVFPPRRLVSVLARLMKNESPYRSSGSTK